MPKNPRTPPFSPTFQPASPDEMKRILAEKLLLPAAEIEAIAAELGAGVWDLAWSVATVTDMTLLESLRESLLEIIQSGGTIRDWKAMLDDIGWRSPLGAWHEDTIFRTTLHSVSEAERYDLLTDSEFVDYLVFDAVDDDVICEECLALDGLTWPRDEFPGDLWPPLHFNCFPPDTQVQGSFELGYRASYQGRMMRIETRQGNVLSVTPNHPIATPAGLVPACKLSEGDDLLAYRSQVEPDPVPPSRPTEDDQHGPTEIDQVFNALGESGMLARCEVVPEHFHHDAAGFQGEIDVAVADGQLLHDIETAGSQAIRDLCFEPVSVAECSHESCGPTELALEGILGTPPCCPSGSELSSHNGIVAANSTPLHSLRFGATPDLDTALSELTRDRGAGDPGLYRELLERYPGVVVLDQVVKVSEFDWSGHVYDLQATSGYIVASGILCSNCRCDVIPADESDLKGLGATMHEGPPPLGHVAEGFDAPPSVRGLNTIVQQSLVERLHAAGWGSNPPMAPGSNP